MSILLYSIAIIAIIVSVVVFYVGKNYEEIHYTDKRTGKVITRIRNKKTKRFTSW